MPLTAEQYDYLLRPIAESRVHVAQGQSHVQAWDIRRTLTRIFGFTGWDEETIEEILVSQIGVEKNGRMGWTVVYRVRKRLTIKDADGNILTVREGSACGDANNLPSIGDAHDFALKTADSQALKRCCIGLGDQFGLSLYNKGNVGAVVGRTLVVPGEKILAETLAETAASDAPVAPEDILDGEVVEPDRSLLPQEDGAQARRHAVDRAAVMFRNDAGLHETALAVYEVLKHGAILVAPAGQDAAPPQSLQEMWMFRLASEVSRATTLEQVDQVMKYAEGTKMKTFVTPVGKSLHQLAVDRKNIITAGGDDKPLANPRRTSNAAVTAGTAMTVAEVATVLDAELVE